MLIGLLIFLHSIPFHFFLQIFSAAFHERCMLPANDATYAVFIENDNVCFLNPHSSVSNWSFVGDTTMACYAAHHNPGRSSIVFLILMSVDREINVLQSRLFSKHFVSSTSFRDVFSFQTTIDVV